MASVCHGAVSVDQKKGRPEASFLSMHVRSVRFMDRALVYGKRHFMHRFRPRRAAVADTCEIFGRVVEFQRDHAFVHPIGNIGVAFRTQRTRGASVESMPLAIPPVSIFRIRYTTGSF
jgi:hypothetical protein